MGGQTFENTRSMTKEEYDDWLNNFKIKTSLIEGVDYVMPFRLKNKKKIFRCRLYCVRYR